MRLCTVCSFPIDPEHCVHSKHTGLWYCSDLDGCFRRARNELTCEEIITFAKVVEASLVTKQGEHGSNHT